MGVFFFSCSFVHTMTSYKICCLGDGGVGKTALTIRLCSNHFVEEYDPTIKDSYRKQVMIDDQTCLLEILDTAGQEEFTALRDQWIRECEGFIVAYSITSSHSFHQVKTFKQQVCRVKDNDNLPMMLVGNKCDLEDEREVTFEEGKALAEQLHCQFKEASAKTKTNVEESFYDLVREIRQRNQGTTEVATPNGTIKSTRKKPAKSSKSPCRLL